MFSTDLKERELIDEVQKMFFHGIDYSHELGSGGSGIDFVLKCKRQLTKHQESAGMTTTYSPNNHADGMFAPSYFPPEYLLWAEAKRGTKEDIYDSMVQLILTIGKNELYTKHLTPPLLAAFDAEKIAFLEYDKVQELFYENVNWKVSPNDHTSADFQHMRARAMPILQSNIKHFDYERTKKELQEFIAHNIKQQHLRVGKIQITRSNFTAIYDNWKQQMERTIYIDWEAAKKHGIYPSDFYLAELLSDAVADGKPHATLSKYKDLHVKLCGDHYTLDIETYDKHGSRLFTNEPQTIRIADPQRYREFWNIYERPPRLDDDMDYIVNHKNLIVPMDVRERKGAFFTPKIWVDLSQTYLQHALGEDWEKHYYVWDCAAGTGNLLEGLTCRDNIFASTIDQSDVAAMHARIATGNLQLYDNHVFQFDFLNDSFSDTKVPNKLREILNNKGEYDGKRLVIYINPPYAEAPKKQAFYGRKEGIRGVQESDTHSKYTKKLGRAGREVFAMFLIRVREEIFRAVLAQFSKLKIVQAPNFTLYRKHFTACFMRGFVVPAATFDGVIGSFPIGFMIWDMNSDSRIENVVLDVYDKDSNSDGIKTFYAYDDGTKLINDWLAEYRDSDTTISIGTLIGAGNDFQNQNLVYICQPNTPNGHFNIQTTKNNIIPCCVYFAVRHCIKATWLNDRDQFLFPNKKWEEDVDFQNNCLVYTLFHGQQRVRSVGGVCAWIPYNEDKLGLHSKLGSRFMAEFLAGRVFSSEASAVLAAGLVLWKYYLSQVGVNINASLYDIKEYFQGRNAATKKMHNKSSDAQYNELMASLRAAMQVLAKAVEKRVGEYGFLKGVCENSL